MGKEYNFKFQDIRYPKIFFQINEKFEEPGGKVPLKTNIDIEHHFEKKGMSVMVRLHSQEHKNTPFAFLVEAMGFFEFNEPINEELAEKVAHINCAAIIFPYVRETAADIIRRGGFPPFHHRPVNFKTYYEDRLKEKAKKTVPNSKKKRQTTSKRKKPPAAKDKTV